MLEETIKYIIAALAGLAMGSFVNCLVWRVNNNYKIATGRSQCIHCGRKLAFWENIPILSYFILKGRCHVCQAKIPAYYPIIEAATALLFVFLFFICPPHESWFLFVRNLFFLSILLLVFVEDILYQTIRSNVVWFGLLVGAIFNIWLGQDIWAMAIGFLVGGGFFLFQYLISKGKWVGGGDVRLGAMLGAWLAFPDILLVLFLAYIAGAVVGLFLLARRKRQWQSAIPFGPFLAAAALAGICSHGVISQFLFRGIF